MSPLLMSSCVVVVELCGVAGNARGVLGVVSEVLGVSISFEVEVECVVDIVNVCCLGSI